MSRIGEIPHFKNIISALIERWRPETNSFHLPEPVCEATVTLSNVAMLLGLPIVGKCVALDNSVPSENITGLVMRLLPLWGQTNPKIDVKSVSD